MVNYNTLNQSTDLFAPVVFRSNFNEFESINSNQAWSLFFTRGVEDKGLGSNPETGRLFNNILLAIAGSSALAGVMFTYGPWWVA
jgi:hypothetical protein